MTRRHYNKAVKLYSNALYGFSIKSLQDKMLAEDVVQEAFMKLWENRKKVPLEKAKAWLFVTAHNKIINMAKKRSRAELTDEIESKVDEVNENCFELKNLIEDALMKLPTLQKNILLFRDLEGYNYKEIGELLGISEQKVRVYLFRARQKVKTIIQAKNVYP